MIKFSLKIKILAIVVFTILFTGMLISYTTISQYSESIANQTIVEIENSAYQLELDVVDIIFLNDIVALRKKLDDHKKSNPNISYIFIIKDGHAIADTFSDGFPVQLIAANRPSDRSAKQYQKIVSQDGSRFIDVSWPIFNGNAGTLRIGVSEKLYREKIKKLWLKSLLISFLILLVSIGIGYFLINRKLHPLSRLAAFAETVKEDQPNQQVDESGDIEISKVSRAFNHMLSRMHNYTKKLQNLNVRLEGKNIELNRAHSQLEASFSISLEISALKNIFDICTYLLSTIRKSVECQNLLIVVKSPKEDRFQVIFNNQQIEIDPEKSSDLINLFQSLSSIEFLTVSQCSTIPLPDSFYKNTKRIGFFPITYQNNPLAAMIVGCPGTCDCIRNELEVLQKMLNQPSGAIYRALIQEEEINQLKSQIETTNEYCGIIGKSHTMQTIYKLIDNVAPTESTVLIQGESGTGKELAAKAIHQKSTRNTEPFIIIDCAAYPSTLIESELFGHEKGAFTGAYQQKIGRFEQANGGTVFLDEIGEINPSIQLKLLRVIQNRSFERVGGRQTIDVDVRIISATNKDLLALVREGKFREDLYYRLNVIQVQMPPLRDRMNDIPLLAHHFLSRFSKIQAKPIHNLDTEALQVLMQYGWPGNVRELENTVEHAFALSKSDRIRLMDLPHQIYDKPQQPILLSMNGQQKTLIQAEKEHLVEILKSCEGNKTLAAKKLGIHRSTLYSKLKKYHIDII